MNTKQRKSPLSRRFGYVKLIVTKFGELLHWISPRIINILKSYIKHSKWCFITYQNASKLVTKKYKLSLCLIFQSTSQCLGLWCNTLPCLIMIYYFHGYAVAFKYRHNGNFPYVRKFITQQQPIDAGVKKNLDTMLIMYDLLPQHKTSFF